MSEYEDGDIVRVSYEGVYSDLGMTVEAANGHQYAASPTFYRKVELVKKAVKPPKVGDVVSGSAGLDPLPRGTIIQDPHDTTRRPTLVKTHEGWRDIDKGYLYTNSYGLCADRIIRYLP